MKTFTTKSAGKIVRKELNQRERQMDLMVLQNESASFQVEATIDQVEDFEHLENKVIDSDVINDELLDQLIDYLKKEDLLEKKNWHGFFAPEVG